MKKLFVALLVLLSILAISCDGNTKTPDDSETITGETEELSVLLSYFNQDFNDQGENKNIAIASALMSITTNQFEKFPTPNTPDVFFNGDKMTSVENGTDPVSGFFKTGTEVTVYGRVSQKQTTSSGGTVDCALAFIIDGNRFEITLKATVGEDTGLTGEGNLCGEEYSGVLSSV